MIINTIPIELEKIILKKSQGNPLIVREFIYELLHQNMITILADHQHKQVYNVYVHNNVWYNDGDDIPVPITLQLFYGARLDKLNFNQLLLLKVASNIGDKFTFYDIYEMYPAHSDNLSYYINHIHKDLKLLCTLGILQSSWPYKVVTDTRMATYSFKNGFLREFILSRMLTDQLSLLEKYATRAHTNQENHLFPTIEWPLTKPEIFSMITIRKNREICEEWKSRYISLHAKQGILCIWLHNDDIYNDEIEPFICLFLGCLRCTIDINTIDDESYRYMASERKYVLILRAERWIKCGNYHTNDRYFFISFENQVLLNNFKDRIDYAIDTAQAVRMHSLLEKRLDEIIAKQDIGTIDDFTKDEQEQLIHNFKDTINKDISNKKNIILSCYMKVAKQNSKLWGSWKKNMSFY